jgi:hypothetical protein
MTNPNGGELGIDALVQPDATVAPLQCLVINQEQCNTISISRGKTRFYEGVFPCTNVD